jgi:hypothetical protein
MMKILVIKLCAYFVLSCVGSLAQKGSNFRHGSNANDTLNTVNV